MCIRDSSQTDHEGATSYYVDYLENKALGGCAEVVVSEMPVDEFGAHHKSVPLDEYGATIIGEMCAAIQQHGALDVYKRQAVTCIPELP